MRGMATRLAGELLVLSVALLGAVAAPPPPPPPPPFILHQLAHHLKGKDEHHHDRAPSVVYAQPAAPLYAQPAAPLYAQPVAPVYAQAPYYPPRLQERLVIQVEPTHHRNLPVALAQADDQGQVELRRPTRVRTLAIKGSDQRLPPHQTFVQVKVDPNRSPGSALGPAVASAPAATASAAAAASVTTHQHVAGANPPFRPGLVLGASGEVSHAQAQAQALASQRSGRSARKPLSPAGAPGAAGAPDQRIRNTIFP